MLKKTESWSGLIRFVLTNVSDAIDYISNKNKYSIEMR